MTPYTASTGETFPTLKALETSVRRILHDGERDLTGEEYELIVWLFDWHPHREEKSDLSRPRIRVGRSLIHGADQFQAQNSVGAWTEWSYRSGLHGLRHGGERYQLKQFAKGCRQAVRAQTEKVKADAYCAGLGPWDAPHPVTCAVTGQPVAWEDAHVDHAPPWEFARIVSEFLRETELDIESFRVIEGQLPRPLAAQFAAYHDARAILRVVHKDVNCGLLRRS